MRRRERKREEKTRRGEGAWKGVEREGMTGNEETGEETRKRGKDHKAS